MGLHEAGIAVMNMCGAPRHAIKATELGVDIICAQGGEGGGHTGEIPTSMLIPAVVDVVKGKISPFTGEQVQVVAAGGIADGRGLAMALSLGASAAWVGTRFICAEEAGAPPRHQKAVLAAGFTDTMRTIIYTGRPLRVIKNDYAKEWATKPNEITELTSKGIIPIEHDFKTRENIGPMDIVKASPLLSGQVAGLVTEVVPAKDIIDEMMTGAMDMISLNASRLSKL